MISLRRTGSGLVAFITLGGAAAAQPPGAAVDPLPSAVVDGEVASSVDSSALASASGGAALATRAEGVTGESSSPSGDPMQDASAAEPSELDARSASLGEASSLNGATGLMRVQSAASGAPGTFRFSLLTGFYSGSGFLCPQCPDQNGEGTDNRDDVRRVSANLFLSATPLDFLEGYLGIYSHSTSTDRPAQQLKQVVGDWNIGLKAFSPPAKDQVLTFGGGLDVGFATGSGQVGISGIDAVNLGLNAMATADLSRHADNPLPLRAHLNAGYRFDNTGKLVKDYESTAGQIDRIERFSLDINRVDFLTLGLGVEGMFDAARPFLEWTIDVPTNRQSYECLRSETRAGDACLRDQAGFSSTPSRLTAGIRLMPWKAIEWWPEGMTPTGALDVATGGSSDFLVEVAPEAPWNVWVGLGFAVDTRTQTKAAYMAAAPSAAGPTVRGRVVEVATDNGIASALVRFDGHDRTGLISTADGGFITPPLEPGAYTFRVSAAGYKDGTCSVNVPGPHSGPGAAPAGDVPTQAADPSGSTARPGASLVLCELEAVPRVSNINGRVSDVTTGDSIANASVRITDMLGRELDLQVDQVGAFRFENVPPGTVIIRVFADGYLKSATRLTVEPLREIDQRFTLAPVPPKSSFHVAGQRLEVNGPLIFSPGSPKLSREAMFVLEELADYLADHAELAHLEIQSHTVEAGLAADALSTERANGIRDALILHGVAARRLSSRGYGGTRPVETIDSPNVLANERIVLTIDGVAQTATLTP
jgi:hypothetical protein